MVLHHNKLQVDYEGSTLYFLEDEKESVWQSLQFHFHAPSEHTFNGVEYAAEMHLVFKGRTYPNELAVIGILFEVDPRAKPNKFLESLKLDTLKAPEGEVEGINTSFKDLYKGLRNHYKYNYVGSLTTPPCTENVQWFVFAETVKIPQKQADILASFFDIDHDLKTHEGNNRNTVEVGSRNVRMIKDAYDDNLD